MNAQGSTVFQVERDGLDSAAFLVGVRRVVVDTAKLDSMVSAAVVRHIDYLLSEQGVGISDPRVADRAEQVEAGLRNVFGVGRGAPTPSTAQFKQLIDQARPGPAPAAPSTPARPVQADPRAIRSVPPNRPTADEQQPPADKRKGAFNPLRRRR
ncbi:hypothetical protein FOS14_03980 [Skermania sp. ID1734]|uniref:hypothetical protein n=1 Tax=Skermania sp. ID1734 TaxID=2597516 RepID=UPI00117EE1F4|nr:hypothetical protein [Skermania sp. ID1734]TSE00939.1 hypothetical protein FOS14_03980 [Skermania sp. ID1734]